MIGRASVTAVVLLATLSQSALPRAKAPIPDAASYLETVEHYRTAPDEAIARVLEMDDALIDRGIAEAMRGGSGWTLDALDAAILMHTDAARLAEREHHGGGAWVQVRRAQLLTTAASHDPESTWFVHQWHTAITAAFDHDARVGALRDQWRQQPWYRLATALDRARALERDGSLRPSGAARRDIDTEIYDASEFSTATPYFEQARAGGLILAAVHLGRMQMLRGHDADARRLFVAAAGQSHSRGTRYLANLFLGSMDERDGRTGSAEWRYRGTLAELPAAQSGRLALASLLARSGRAADARTILTESGSRPAIYDPWWSYLPPDPRDFATILASLRAEVIK